MQPITQAAQALPAPAAPIPTNPVLPAVLPVAQPSPAAERPLPGPQDCASGNANGHTFGGSEMTDPLANDHDRGAMCAGGEGNTYFYGGGHPHTGCGEAYVMNQKVYDFRDGPTFFGPAGMPVPDNESGNVDSCRH